MNSDNMTDKNIDLCIKHIADGDMLALKTLYEELRFPIYKFALSIVKSTSTAEDIAQETFLRIRVSAKSYRSTGKPRAWIFSIVRNLAITELRKTSKIINIEDYNNSLTTEGNNTFEIDELSLLEILKPDEKEIVSLHVLADLNHKDIAKALNISYSQVRWKYSYAIKKLKKHLVLKGNSDK